MAEEQPAASWPSFALFAVAAPMLGYMFGRGGGAGLRLCTHAIGADRRRDEEDVADPKIENVSLPESRPFEERGFHRKLYRFNPNDYKDVAAVWRG